MPHVPGLLHCRFGCGAPHRRGSQQSEHQRVELKTALVLEVKLRLVRLAEVSVWPSTISRSPRKSAVSFWIGCLGSWNHMGHGHMSTILVESIESSRWPASYVASDCRIGLVSGSNEAPPNRGRAGLKGRLWHLFSRLMSQELALRRPFMLERASATQLSESGHVVPTVVGC